MSRRLSYLLSVMHDTLDFSGQCYDAPSFLRDGRSDADVLRADWALLCADGQRAVVKMLGAPHVAV